MEDRFDVALEESTGLFGVQVTVLVDRLSGVQYLFVKTGAGAGLTVLVDSEGKPLLAEGHR